MAKRKTPKVKNLVEKPTSITEEQLESLQGLIKKMNGIQAEMGRIELHKHNLAHEFKMLESAMQEEQVALQKQYGKVNINLQDGTITEEENVEVNKKD